MIGSDVVSRNHVEVAQVESAVGVYRAAFQELRGLVEKFATARIEGLPAPSPRVSRAIEPVTNIQDPALAGIEWRRPPIADTNAPPGSCRRDEVVKLPRRPNGGGDKYGIADEHR